MCQPCEWYAITSIVLSDSLPGFVDARLGVKKDREAVLSSLNESFKPRRRKLGEYVIAELLHDVGQSRTGHRDIDFVNTVLRSARFGGVLPFYAVIPASEMTAICLLQHITPHPTAFFSPHAAKPCNGKIREKALPL